MNALKIVKLGAENVKRLKAVEIIPAGNTVTISGKNDQGKTSILDAIEYALGGSKAICEEPIRKGQAKARIVCDLGEIVVERKFNATSGDSTLTVRGKDGSPVKSPQALLDSLCSHIAFDPLSFVRMKSPEQVETMRKLTGLDFTELNQRRQKSYDERTLVGRQLEAAKARLSLFPFHENTPEQEVDISDASKKLEVIKQQRAANSSVRQSLASVNLRVESLTKNLTEIAEHITTLECDLKTYRELLEKRTSELGEAKTAQANAQLAASTLVEDNESEILASLSAAQQINDKVRANRLHVEQNAEVQKQQSEHDRLSHEIETIDQDKADKLAWAEFPLEGLSFDDNRVLLNGVPFSQSSQARQLQAAVAIGLALNPKVRVIIVRDASLLDDESMELVKELAVKHDAQIWLEVVNSKDPSAVVIEDGEVKS